MTPEDRASKVICELDERPYDAKVSEADIVAAAIRAAENDALERAASQVVAFLGGSAISSQIAEGIRGLKHKEAT